MQIFRRDRARKLRSEWRSVAAVVFFALLSLCAAIFASGTLALTGAGLFGAMLTMLIVLWTVGDVTSLRFAWGAVGEQQTADLLARLPDGWMRIHDVPRSRAGNWDHVVIAPAGVFVIETKQLSDRAFVRDDALRSGRLRFEGGNLRSAAVELAEAVGARVHRRPWVQPVLVVWGDFEQDRVEERRVAYLSSGALLDWLLRQPQRMPPGRVGEIARAVEALKRLDHEAAVRGADAGRA